MPFFGRGSSAFSINILTFSDARHSSPPRSISLSTSSSNSSSGSAPRTSNYHYLSTFLSALTPLCTSHPNLFSPHLVSLLTFLPALILPPVDCGLTVLHRQWVDLSMEIEGSAMAGRAYSFFHLLQSLHNLLPRLLHLPVHLTCTRTKIQ